MKHESSAEEDAVLFEPLVRTSKGFYVTVAVLLAIIAPGAYAYLHQLLTGLGVTGLNRPVFWGLYMTNFVFFIGIFNPILDREVLITPLGIPITGGWISFFSIILKFVLTVSTALLLIALTSFPGICEALARLKVPRIFVVQLLFLYRYIFVLLEEALKMLRAREARSFGKKGREIPDC